MPVRCYYKPNRTTKRQYTEKDAARVLCYVAKDGVIDLAGVFDQFEICGEEIAKEAVKKYITKKLCEIFGKELSNSFDAVSKIANPFRVLRLYIDSIDGLIADLENFQFTVLGLTATVPQAITNPMRQFIDRIQEAVQTIDDAVTEITAQLLILLKGCENGASENE